MKATKATIYYQSGLLGNICKREVREIEVKVAPYAQYKEAVHCQFIAKGARTPRAFVQSYKPSLLVLEGWGHPEPEEAFKKVKEDQDIVVSESRYHSFDERWQSDFDRKLEEHVKSTGAKILADYRNFNSYGA